MTSTLKQWAALAAIGIAAAVLAGCQKTTGSVYGASATSGVAHTEPVHFNGQRYQVTFKYQSSYNGYDVSVKRPKRPLRETQKDKADSVEVMTSALRHFACANGQSVEALPGSTSYQDRKVWALKARCA